MREARARKVEKQQQEEAEIAVKATQKEFQAAAKLLKEQEKKERRVAREEQKVVQERDRTGKLAACAARIEAQKPRNHLQIPKQASAKPHKVPLAIPSQNRPRAVLQLSQRLHKLHQHPYPKSTPAAGRSIFQPNINSTNCLPCCIE
jgi:hypothetical protein